MEVEIPNTDIEIVDSADIEVITTVDVIGNVSNDLEITFDDNEYSIVGDDMVVMTNYDDAPQWLKDTIGNIVNIKTAIAIGDLDATKEALDVMLSELEVAKNTYELSIISSEDIDERITTAITTLNSSLREADATILQIAQTAVTPEEATAISINTLSASLSSNGTIGSAIHQLNVAMSTLENTTAENLSYLSSAMEGEINGNAEAMQTIRTYVGIDENGNNTGVGLLTDVEILQKQNDGIIETITGTYDVMLGIEDPNNNTDNDQLDVTKEPYASWLAEDVANGNIAKRSAHVGDVYIKYSNSDSGYKSYEKAYKFIRTVVDTTSPYATDSAGFTWSLIVDTDAQNAYVAALNAYDLADDKRRMFVGLGATSTPSVPYDRGDLWLIDAARVVNGYSCKVGDILRCIEPEGKIGVYEENDWVLASSYANAVDAQNQQFLNFVNNDYAGFVASIQSQVDRKAETFYQNSIPTGRIKSINVPDDVTLNTYVGDLWKNTYVGTISGYLGNNTEYIYTKTANGSNWNYDWVKMEVPDIVFDTIDTKKSIYSGNSVPVAVYPDVIEVNDMWIPSVNTGTYKAGEVYIYNGTTWVVATKYTEDLDAFVSGTYTPTVASLQSQVDGQISYYFFDSSLGQSAASVSGSSSWTTDALKKEHNGDIAYDTKLELGYWYDRSVSNWVQITGAQNAGVIEALKKAAEAKGAADSVIVSYYAWKQTTAPATQYKWMKDDNTLWEYVGSTWVVVDVKKDDTLTAYNNTTKDTTLYVHNGSVWTMITPNGIVANAKAVTDLNASLSSLGTTVSGHTSLLNTVDTRIGAEGARVETRFAYNSTVNIGGIYKKSGFGLTTNYTSGSGTLADPYVSEFWIDASRFKFTNSNVTGSVAPFSIEADGPQPQVTFNGKVTFSNVTGASSSANMLYNSAPAIGLETKGWHVGYNDTGLTSSGLLATGDPFRPTGYGAFHQYINGTPAVGRVFDIIPDGNIPVIGGKFYEASAYLNTHRCNGQIFIQWHDAAGAIITWTMSTILTQTNAQGNLADWGRSSIICQAPTNATSCYLCIRGISTGESNPYVFVSMCYFGRASEGQTIISNWSEGISAGVSSGDVVTEINSGLTTTIDGGRITTGSVTANQIRAGSISADRLSSTSGTGTVWTGGGLVSANFNGNVNGSIGSPTQGFRLSSNAAGTTTDPNIYGAYIKGSTIEGSTVNVTDLKVQSENYPGKFGPIYRCFTVAFEQPALIGPNFIGSYSANRFCSYSRSTVKLECWYRARGNYVSCVLEYSLSSNPDVWTTIADRSAQMYGYLDFMYLSFSEFFNVGNIPTSDICRFRIRPTSGNDYSFSPILITISNG